MERRLAAILAADVVGYSRLMEADEAGTLEQLKTHRKELIDPGIAGHNGRIVKTTGDGVLVEFASVVDAVQCAVEMQRGMAERNARLPKDRRIVFRIGINLGDIIVDVGDIYGDGVNVAARLEGLADAGGIFISGTVYDHLKTKIAVSYEDLGEQHVKNIAEPVRVYRVLPESCTLDGGGGVTKNKRNQRHGRRPSQRNWIWTILAAGVATLVVALAGVGWLEPWSSDVEPASMERMAFPLPEKPSIAVLPFDNMSGDSGQDHVASGLTEDIITALSQVSSLFVIARNSTFVYRGKPVKVQRVAEELGVRYVLEGSVRTSGEQVRIAAQLIDALTGNHVWAERYDRQMTELFALQDEITERIVTALQIKLTAGEQMRVHRKHTRSIEAWKLLGRGVEHFYRSSKADNTIARQWLEKAIEVDREYALAYALLAWTHWLDAFHGWSEDRERSFERASILAEKARTLDGALPDVYALQGAIHLFKREYDEAVEAAEKAVAFNPGHANNTALLAMILHNADRLQEAIRMYRLAMRLSPYYPDWILEDLGFTYLDAERPGDALVALEKFLDRKPSAAHAAHAHIGRALAFHSLGQDDQAQTEVAKAVEVDPGISATKFGQLSLNKNRSEGESGLAILRRLGLPD